MEEVKRYASVQGQIWFEHPLGEMVKHSEYATLQANLKTWGIIELAVSNPNVSSYMEHWEGRAVKAEHERDLYRDGLEARDAELSALKRWINDNLSGLPGSAAECLAAAGIGLPGK